MSMWFKVATCFLLTSASAALAQQPYAGLETRPIKALSAQQIADLKAGRGMGYALAAELNGYPGPAHVLELAAQLALTDAQRATVERLHAEMKREAIALGEKAIAQEAALDAQFAQKTITPASLDEATRAIGETQAALRRSHLSFHLATLAVLTKEQSERYAVLRGYANAGAHHGRQPRHR